MSVQFQRLTNLFFLFRVPSITFSCYAVSEKHFHNKAFIYTTESMNPDLGSYKSIIGLPISSYRSYNLYYLYCTETTNSCRFSCPKRPCSDTGGCLNSELPNLSSYLGKSSFPVPVPVPVQHSIQPVVNGKTADI